MRRRPVFTVMGVRFPPAGLLRLVDFLPIVSRSNPSYEVDVDLDPGQAMRVGFRVDLRRTARGEAQVFHLQQLGPTKTRQGGLTLLLLKVD
jgi:hypothetical protein